MAILFNSARPLGQCENITAIWNAYAGDKCFCQGGWIDISKFNSCDIVITDEFVRGKSPNQTIVMIGHGLIGFKTYGIDQPGPYDAADCKLTDYYICSGEDIRSIAASSSGIPIERCIPLGMPRTDSYIDQIKGSGETGLDKYDRVYLYVPTFRSYYNQPTPFIRYRYLDSIMDNDEILLVKPHMIVKEHLVPQGLNHIFEVSNNIPLRQLLIDCDVCITDFSSAIGDGYLLNKPSVLVADEHDDYLKSRGMYLEYPFEYSSRWVSIKNNEDRFLFLLRDAAEKGMTEIEHTCLNKIAGACDGHSTERLLHFIHDITS